MAGKGKIENLKPFTKENAREMGRRGGKKQAENIPKRKAMREIYEEILQTEGEKIKRAFANGIDNGNIAFIKELREGTDGSKINLSGTVKTEMETAEDRIKLFEEITGQ